MIISTRMCIIIIIACVADAADVIRNDVPNLTNTVVFFWFHKIACGILLLSRWQV